MNNLHKTRNLDTMPSHYFRRQRLCNSTMFVRLLNSLISSVFLFIYVASISYSSNDVTVRMV